MDELIGFDKPNDLAAVVLRAKLAKRFGLFGIVPMWGDVRLHEFYPPLSTFLVRCLTMKIALVFYFAVTFVVWAVFINPVTAVLYILSYYHLDTLLRVGRFSEFLGYPFVVLAYFIKNDILSGIFLGLAALSHPIPLIFGSALLVTRLSWIPYAVGFLICGWWYIPYALKWKKFAFIKRRQGKEDKKIFYSGISYITPESLEIYLTMPNLLLFLFFPIRISILGILWWFSPFFSEIRQYHRIKRVRLYHLKMLKPFFLSNTLEKLPGLREIKGRVAILAEPISELSPPQAVWRWAAACYLFDKGIIVYNGLPAPEVPSTKIFIPSEIKTVTVKELSGGKISER